ncbi:SRPBCC domain-containing protein [Nonomuraea sp. NPDC050790]|uniref:SRPBCC domain-containing protein n=1 Tax=Nonomuraea sp. NPDC050790 TaxID=3364371 RepID=UPI00379BE834
MGKDFHLEKETELRATPAQVWDAIATGPGLSSWMFPFAVEPGVGGVMRLDLPGVTDESTITGWDPPHRLTVKSKEGEDGTFQAFEYLVEGRDGDTTVLRFIHTGHTGDGWGEEYVSSLNTGWDQYFYTLTQYFLHFPGRTAAYALAEGPKGQENLWERFSAALGLPATPSVGDHVTLTPDGSEGVVDYMVLAGPKGFMFGVRTPDAFYRFHGLGEGMGGGVDMAAHLFATDDTKKTEHTWKSFLAKAFN